MGDIVRTSKTQWLAFGLITLQWFLITQTAPFAGVVALRWYHFIVMSALAVILMNRGLSWKSLGKFKWIYITSAIGILLMLIGMTDTTESLIDVIKLSVSILTFVMIIPVLSHPNARRIMFFAVLYTAFARSIIILEFSTFNNLEQEGLEGLSGFGKNKNESGMLLSMAVVIMLPLLIIKETKIITRICSFLLISWYIYWLITAGSRSALVSCTGAAIIVMIIHYYYINGISIKLRITTVSVIFMVFSMLAIQILTDKHQILDEAFIRFTELLSGERGDINNRLLLFEYGIDDIKSHPIIGTGIGSSEFLFKARTLTHNHYMAVWIERGVFEIISLIILIFFMGSEIKLQFKKYCNGQLNINDHVLAFCGVPLMIMLFTINGGTIVVFVTAIYAGYVYERNYIKVTQKGLI